MHISACAYSSKTLQRLLSREPGLALDSGRWLYHSACTPLTILVGAQVWNRVWIRLKSCLITHSARFASHFRRCRIFSNHWHTWLTPSDPIGAMWGIPSLSNRCWGAFFFLLPGETPHQIHTVMRWISLQGKRPTIVPLAPPNGGANDL